MISKQGAKNVWEPRIIENHQKIDEYKNYRIVSMHVVCTLVLNNT